MCGWGVLDSGIGLFFPLLFCGDERLWMGDGGVDGGIGGLFCSLLLECQGGGVASSLS